MRIRLSARAGVALCALILTGAGTAKAQTVDTIDLAKAAPHDTTKVKPGRYRFQISSLAFKYTYVIKMSTGVEAIPPIEYEEGQGAADPAITCSELKKAVDGLKNAVDETKVPDAKTAAQAALKKEGGVAACKEHKDNAEKLIAATDTVPDLTFDLSLGDYVVVSVSRMEDGKATKQWDHRFTTGALGEWRTTYGYTFPILRTCCKKWEPVGELLHTKSLDSTHFLVASQRRVKSFDALPSIMFSYAFGNERLVRFGWSVGLGADVAKPQIMTGPSLTIASNFVIAAGVVAHEEDVPSGVYAPGDTVREKLDSDVLTQKAFRSRPFIAITIRFDKNPFTSGKVSGATEEKKPEAKKPDDKEAKKTDTKQP